MRPAREILAGFEALPLVGVDDLLRGRRALILAPHPDDESLGCGGLIAAACAAGLAPVVVILTDGAASHPESRSHPPEVLRALREDEARRAAGILGLPAERLFFLREPDTKLTASGPVIETLLERVEAHDCGLVIGPWAGDPHCDHAAAAAIAEAVAIRAGMGLLSYPVWGWLHDGEVLVAEQRTGGWRLDIGGFVEMKQRAIAAHESQYGEVILDAPEGFRLPRNLLAVFERGFEVFLEA